MVTSYFVLLKVKLHLGFSKSLAIRCEDEDKEKMSKQFQSESGNYGNN